MNNLSKEPYKGTRDFYPDDFKKQQAMFNVLRSVIKSFGYDEYHASILEETDLYRSKSGEELINEQTYSFTDRGGREVTLRPEMTPTVARMVANKRKELIFPLRWFSIPNCFRYERPQKGRTREFWQLNVDLLGIDSNFADMEIIKLASECLRGFNADETMYTVYVNDRLIVRALFEYLGLNEVNSHSMAKLLDKKRKLENSVFEEQTRTIIVDIKKADEFIGLMNMNSLSAFTNILGEDITFNVTYVLKMLNVAGYSNIEFDGALMRGLDYYTGIVFEVFDTDPTNNRALFGGGRYDGLVDIFNVAPVAAVGFGMGDAPLYEFIETHNLIIPEPVIEKTAVLATSYKEFEYACEIADNLRKKSSCVCEIVTMNIGTMLKNYEKRGIQICYIIGEEEFRNKTVTRKDLKNFKQDIISIEEI